MKRVALFGTHPSQMNGYSRVVAGLMQRLEMYRCVNRDDPDLDLYIFGFQNFHHSNYRALCHTKVFDAAHHENPKEQGFGYNQVPAFFEAVRPDLCIVYNDMMVVSQIVTKLVEARNQTGHACKIVVYIDQVYPFQRVQFVHFLNQHADAIIAFTDYWADCIRKQGLRDMPMYILHHGLDVKRTFPIPTKYARMYFGFEPNEFLVLNLNRNQPRKRWDTCVMAWVQFVSNHMDDPVKLIVGTAISQEKGGSWNILELFHREFSKHGIDIQKGMKHVVFIDRPQMLSDADVNILNNACDVGINTCDGEGWGLCNFEMGALGKGQIVSRVGGFLDMFTDDSALFVEPALRYYVDSTRDGVGGEASMCDPRDFVEALEKYYKDPALREAHGAKCRRHVLERFDLDDVARQFERIIDAETLVVEEKKDIQVVVHELPIVPKKKKKKKKKMNPELRELRQQVQLLTSYVQSIKAIQDSHTVQ